MMEKKEKDKFTRNTKQKRQGKHEKRKGNQENVRFPFFARWPRFSAAKKGVTDGYTEIEIRDRDITKREREGRERDGGTQRERDGGRQRERETKRKRERSDKKKKRGMREGG